MKLTAEALRDFLANLPHYDRLAAPDRRALSTIERPSQSCSAYVVRDSLPRLIAAGFLLPASPNGRCAIVAGRQEFIRTLRMFWKHGVFENPGQRSFEGYMNDLFTSEERERLRSNTVVGYNDQNRVLYREITSPDWVQSFMGSRGGQWEAPHMKVGAPALFERPQVLAGARSLVRCLMDRGQPAPIGQLAKALPDAEQLCASLYACLRYALLFVSIYPGTMDAVVGVWPTMMTTGETKAIPLPQSVTPTETFDSLFLVEDVTAVVVACATEPLPVRADGGGLYAKTVREIVANLRPLPKWVSQAFDMEPETRLRTALAYAHTFGLVEDERFPARTLLGERGRAWLALPVGDRLRVLMDGILDRKQSIAAFRDFRGAAISATGARIHTGTTVKPLPDFVAATMKPFQSLEGEGFFALRDIDAFGQSMNPLLAIYRKDKNAYFSSEVMYLHGQDAEQLQKAWSATLHAFVRVRLLPLGGVRVGNGKQGVSIAITPAGRYYLGQAREWQWAVATDSQVIVQPNFEVTFLGESPAAEVEIARFAERRGHGIGALFQITKKSIVAAAAADMTAESTLEILDRVCSRELPANVRREIQGWFGQCRKVSFESSMLVRCPDRETALRVMALAKDAMTALNDTVLEYRDVDGKQRPKLIKRLKEMGVLVSVHENVSAGKSRSRGW